MTKALRKPPVIAAASAGQARAYATRRKIPVWVWVRDRRDVREAWGHDVILLPGWQTHWLANDIEVLFVLSLRLRGTDIAKAAVSG